MSCVRVIFGGVFAIIVALTNTSAASDGPEPAAAANQAIEMYREAQGLDDTARRKALFARAASAFIRLAQLPTNSDASAGEAFANAGTAFLQAGDTGQAVLAFRRALQAAPRHERARRTLREVRTTLPVWVPRPTSNPDDSFFTWHRASTVEERLTVMLVSFWLAAAIAALGIALRVGWLVWTSAVPALVFTAALASTLVTHLATDVTHGVITAPDAIARTADSVNATSRFVEPLPVGTEVRIEEVRQYWTRVRLADGSAAWLKRGAVTPL